MYMLLFLHGTSLAECFITHDTWILTLSKCIPLRLFRTYWWLKDLLQTPREYGQSPLYMRWCSLRLLCLVNDLLHTSQEYRCSPMCMCWWCFRLVHWMKDLLRASPTYRRSLPCTCKCCFSLWLYEWFIAHMTVIWVLPTVYGLMIPQTYLPTKWLLHTTHTYQYSMSCMCLCWFTVLRFSINNLLHTTHAVDTFMLLLLNLLNERLVTCAAGIQAYPTVCALMFNNHTRHITYLLTPWCRVLLDQLTGLQLVKKFPAFHGTPKVHYRTHKRPPPVSILGQPNPVHIPTSHLLQIHPNIIHPSTPRPPQWSLPPVSPPRTYTRHMPSPSHSSRFYHPHNVGWGVQIT